MATMLKSLRDLPAMRFYDVCHEARGWQTNIRFGKAISGAQVISFGGSAFHGSWSIIENFNCLQVTFNCHGDVRKMKTTYLQIEGDNLKGNDGQGVVVIKAWPNSFQSQPSDFRSLKRKCNE